MSPVLKSRIVDRLVELVPLPSAECAYCDPNGGCANPHECRKDLCLGLLDVIEQEGGLA